VLSIFTFQHSFLIQDGLDAALGVEVLKKSHDPQLGEPVNNNCYC